MPKLKARLQIKGFSKPMHLPDVLMKAEEVGVYAIASEMTGIGYAYEDGWISMAAPSGYMKMPVQACKVMCEELLGIIEEIEDIKKNKRHEF